MEATNDRSVAAMRGEPQKEHQWLQRLVGEWTFEAEGAPTESGQGPVKSSGTETVRMLGGLWLLAEGEGEMPGGGDATTLLTLGYDPHRSRYVGTWVGSMMTYLWVYEGELDADQRVLTLDTEGPSMAAEGKTTRYRDVIELESADHRAFTSHMLAEDGSWQQLMTAHYRRKK